MKIFIDVGHGGKDNGASNGNLIEKNMNLVTANAMAELLIKYGCEVKLSRTNDIYLSLTQRTTMANNWGADLFVSCHYNAGGGDRGEVIHSVYYGKATVLSQNIAKELKALGQTVVKEYSKLSTSGKGDYYTVIADTTMPAVIAEGCFIDNVTDRQIADTPEEQKEIGYAIARGVLSFLGINIEDIKPSFKHEIISGCHIVRFKPLNFGIYQEDKKKRDFNISNYFSLGFWADLDGVNRFSAGNLADCGRIISQSKNFPSWINTSNKKLTTLYVKSSGETGIIKTNDLSIIGNIKTAVSGIPILINGNEVSLSKDIKMEGYFGNELRLTTHGFLTFQDGDMVFIGATVGSSDAVKSTTLMANLLKSLGFTKTVIKLDGGGSFILVINGIEVFSTVENRIINNTN